MLMGLNGNIKIDKTMIIYSQQSEDIITEELSKDAIINNDHEGFPKDYLVLHCLLKVYEPKTFLEIGTHRGTGTKIIKNALGEGSTLYSMDLPPDMGHVSWNYSEDVGVNCDLPFIQLRADSTKFNYQSIYPIDGWFVDGGHTYDNVLIESKEAIKSGAKLIIYHDANVKEVYDAILDAFEGNEDYYSLKVEDTRILYAVKK